MKEFLKIFGLTILGIIAFMVIALLGVWLLIWIWPIVIIALPIALIVYLIQLIQAAKPKSKNRKGK